MSVVTKIFGTHSERELKRIYPIVDKVESYRDTMMALSDEELPEGRRALPGSVAFVPSVAGLIIAGEVIKDLARK